MISTHYVQKGEYEYINVYATSTFQMIITFEEKLHCHSVHTFSYQIFM